MHMTFTRAWNCFWTSILLLTAVLTGSAQCAPPQTDTVESGLLEETKEDAHQQQEFSSDVFQRLDKLGDLLSRYDTDDQLADTDDLGRSVSKRNADLEGADNPLWYGPRLGKAKRDLGEGDDGAKIWFGPRLGKRNLEEGNTDDNLWFGPRLGKRSEHIGDYYDDDLENLSDQLMDAIKRTPHESPASTTSRQWWGPVARRSPFVPRLGKREEEESLEVEEANGLLSDSSDYDINMDTRAAFSPRLGKKNLGFAPRLGKKATAFAPRLGKKNLGFAPRLGKRGGLGFAPRLGKKATAFAPRLGKRTGLGFAPRLGRSDTSVYFSESDKRTAFAPRLGRSPAFAPRLGRAAFSPRLG